MEGIRYLESLETWDFNSAFTPENIKKVLEHLDNPQDKPKSVHVAGTNGKGSVCTALGAILSKAGYSVGLNTSPHLLRLSERFIINGREVSLELISNAIMIVKQATEQISCSLSYHEVLTATAFVLFKDLDWIVIETGLGGRLDASSVIRKPEISIISSIGLDHTNILGNTVQQIAYEKAGIIKDNSLVLIGDLCADSLPVIQQVTEERKAKLFQIDLDYRNYKEHNNLIAKKAANLLNLPDAAILQGLDSYFIPARLEEVEYRGKKFILDAAHNLPAIKALIATLNQGQKYDLIFGAINTKDWKQVIKTLSSYIVNWNIVNAKSSAKVNSTEIIDYLSGLEIRNFKRFDNSYQSAIENALQSEQDCILVTGSIYMLGGIRQVLVPELPRYW